MQVKTEMTKFLMKTSQNKQTFQGMGEKEEPDQIRKKSGPVKLNSQIYYYKGILQVQIECSQKSTQVAQEQVQKLHFVQFRN